MNRQARSARLLPLIRSDFAFMTRFFPSLLTALALLAASVPAHASVVITGTRIIFAAQEREATVNLVNNGKDPSLVQVWVDDGDTRAAPETIQVPFTVTPVLARVEPAQGQSIRLLHTGSPMASDRESLFWFNMLEVPPKTKDSNVLQLAFRTRIKLLYRPQGLPGKAEDAPALVTWHRAPGQDGKPETLVGRNPSAYYVNLGEIKIEYNGKSTSLGTGYIAPYSLGHFISSSPVNPRSTVNFTSINDYGAGNNHNQLLSSRPASTPSP